MTRRVAFAACLLVAAAGCGAPVFRPPTGPGTPVPDASTAWTQATRICRDVRTFVAELRVSGRAGSQRFPTFTIATALDDQGSIYLSATHSSSALFLLAGRSETATLWLRRDGNRRVEASAGDIVDAMLGVRLPPARLLAVLTGCGTREFDVKEAARFNGLLRVVTPDAVVFLQQQGGAWRTHAVQVDGFTVQYQQEGTSVPQRIMIHSDPGRPEARLDVRVSQAELNGTLRDGLFNAPSGAASADPMSLEELRKAFRGEGGH